MISPPTSVPPTTAEPTVEERDERKWVQAHSPTPPTREGTRGVWKVEVPPSQWHISQIQLSQILHHRLSTLWAEIVPAGTTRLHGLWLGKGPCAGVLVSTELLEGEARVTTLLPHVPSALYFEREVREMFGVEFAEAPDTRPLLLHLSHPAPPFRAPASPNPQDPVSYTFLPTEGEGLYEIPVGPVHAGIIEPGQFRFQVLGEQILNLEVRLGFTHKGTERLFENRTPAQGLPLAESVSGDSSVAGAMAYLEAVEPVLGIRPSKGTQRARGLLLEAERVAFLLGDVSGISMDVGYAAGAAQANVLRQEAYSWLESLTGSRLGRSTLSVGGLYRPLPARALEGLSLRARALSDATRELLEHLDERSSVVDRIHDTGQISREVARNLALVGPVARASGIDGDVRRDRPYGPYREVDVRVALRSAGDVEARLQVKGAEILEACRLVEKFLDGGALDVPRGPETSDPLASGEGMGIVEAPRGELVVAVRLGKDSRVLRVHFRDPSYLNWPAIEYAVRGNIVPDFPLCNKSLNLSYSGFDR